MRYSRIRSGPTPHWRPCRMGLCRIHPGSAWAYSIFSCTMRAKNHYTYCRPPGRHQIRVDRPYRRQWCLRILQVITVYSSGKYTVILTPVTGSACNDTITDSRRKAPGPPPHPDSHADTICAGQPNPVDQYIQSHWWYLLRGFYNLGLID